MDYDEIENNYKCERSSQQKISLKKIESLKPVVFDLLGNTLASVLLPEKILILEGSSDTVFLKKCLELLEKNDYAVHNARSDGNIKYALNVVTQFLRFNDKNLSIYKENVYVVAVQNRDVLIREWKRLLSKPDSQLKVLEKNGIEYYYPERALKEIFESNQSKDEIVEGYLEANPNEYSNKRITKNELAKAVAELLTEDDLGDQNNQLFVFLKTLP